MIDEANVMRAAAVMAEAQADRERTTFLAVVGAAQRAASTKAPVNTGLKLLGCEVVVQPLSPVPAVAPETVGPGTEAPA